MMKRRAFVKTFIAGAMALPALTGAQPGPGPGKGPGMGPGGGMMQHKWSRERMYGSPMMTLEERQEHQRQMWNAKTAEERQKIRDEHRKQMIERAKQQNYKIDQGQDDAYSVPVIPK
jgi:Spy/CpxP family protein refolding chaperone